MVNDLLPEILQ